ncbi:alpha/beta hydrolase domain-containing protein [Pseudofrankia sp. BMG5.37]|uniref:alpha/beta hydrolase domain-containing protein n=1 Tax=Pseudofrankia sp. BMG5.37 TaxID=3050035 RepID=UPI0037C731A8
MRRVIRARDSLSGQRRVLPGVRCLGVISSLVAVGLVASACSSSDTTGTTSASSSAEAPSRPVGPAATFQELAGGKGVNMGSPVSVNLQGTGYVEQEYAASGTATSYKAQGGYADDGRWTFTPDSTAAYSTRVLVRRPAAAKDFNGTVVVEWLNVSSGVDSDVEWWNTHEEIMRQGDIWVGVSAQRIGVMGGPALTPSAAGSVTPGLKGTDPARYGSLNQPGDGYAFDIFTQVARTIRAGATATGGLTPRRLLAAGESQSAYAMVAYLNGVQPLTHEFDGFLVHSRGAGAMALAAPGQPASIQGANATPATIIRTDTDVPVIDVQTEGDLTVVLNSVQARQPDTNRFRLWEVAGASHADTHSVGPFASALNCAVAINNSPTHIVVKAALHALDAWARTGTPPPTAPRIDVTTGATPQVVRDADGIARGGIRTPPVAVPVDVLSGTPDPNPSSICVLFGSTTPLPATRLAALYPSRDAYLQKYNAATDATIKAGFALTADRPALIAYAQPSRIL